MMGRLSHLALVFPSIKSAEQRDPHGRHSWCVTPMAPFPLSNLSEADRAIHDRDTTPGNQDPAQRLAVSEKRRGVDGEPHEQVSDSVEDHQAVDELLIRSGGQGFEFKEDQGVAGS